MRLQILNAPYLPPQKPLQHFRKQAVTTFGGDMMKKFSFAIPLSLLLVSGAANADDTGWGGPHIGVYTSADADTAELQDYWCWASCGGLKLEKVRPAIGVTLGVDSQIANNLVIGLEGDFGTGGNQSKPVGSTLEDPELMWRTNVDWRATARVRAGAALDDTLIYITAGFAAMQGGFSNVSDASRYSRAQPGADWGADWSGTTTGYVYGAGVEQKFGEFSAKLEFTRTAYGNRDACYKDLTGVRAGLCWDPQAFYTNGESFVAFSPSVSSIKAGLNYRF